MQRLPSQRKQDAKGYPNCWRLRPPRSLSWRTRSPSPQRVTIQKGATVVWINQEADTHTVTADDGKFDSGDLDLGGMFSFTFNEAGTFPYYCEIHGDRGGVDMAGTIVVE